MNRGEKATQLFPHELQPVAWRRGKVAQLLEQTGLLQGAQRFVLPALHRWSLGGGRHLATSKIRAGRAPA